MTIELTDAEAKDLLAVCDAACRACGLDAALVAAPIVARIKDAIAAAATTEAAPEGT